MERLDLNPYAVIAIQSQTPSSIAQLSRAGPRTREIMLVLNQHTQGRRVNPKCQLLFSMLALGVSLHSATQKMSAP